MEKVTRRPFCAPLSLLRHVEMKRPGNLKMTYSGSIGGVIKVSDSGLFLIGDKGRIGIQDTLRKLLIDIEKKVLNFVSNPNTFTFKKVTTPPHFSVTKEEVDKCFGLAASPDGEVELRAEISIEIPKNISNDIMKSIQEIIEKCSIQLGTIKHVRSPEGIPLVPFKDEIEKQTEYVNEEQYSAEADRLKREIYEATKRVLTKLLSELLNKEAKDCPTVTIVD